MSKNLSGRKKVITIDGFAATGKSSLAKGLAQKLNFEYLGTGLLYRTLALLCINNKIFTAADLENKISTQLLNSLTLKLFKSSGNEVVIKAVSKINGVTTEKDFFSDDLQSEQVSMLASKIAAFKSVRDFLLPVQQLAFEGMPIIAEGRDAGTVVFPDALIKVFVEVPAQIRALRRFNQSYPDTSKILPDDIEKIKKQIEIDILERDQRDQSRDLAPCIPAKNAIIYQNTRLSLTQAVDELYDQVLALEEFADF